MAIRCASSRLMVCCAFSAEGLTSRQASAMPVAICLFIFILMVFSSNAYKIGTTISVNTVAENSPPMTTVASGRCTSAPAELLMAMGRKPSMAAVAVSRMGRRRSRVPVMMRSRRSATPSACNVLKRLISTRPLSTATPKSTMNPTPADMLNGMPRRANARMPPMVASGTAI